jgi:ComF family protein
LGLFVLEMLYPRRCVRCGDPLLFSGSTRFPLCRRCAATLSPIAAVRRCSVCSIPLISELRTCPRCSQRRFSFKSNLSVYEYRDSIRQIIVEFKFFHRRSLANLIAHLLHAELKKRYTGLPVVPVPGSPRSVRRRGWDPMREVAKSLQRGAGWGTFDALKRRGSSPQKGLGYAQRMENITDTIRLRRSAGRRGPLPGRVVLLDDIFTSGATAEECAQVLLHGGVGEVYVLTLAIEA